MFLQIMVDHLLFPFPNFDISIRPRDICDQNLKLFEIVPNFGPLLAYQILGMHAPPPKLYPKCHACIAARHMEKFREVTPPNPTVI